MMLCAYCDRQANNKIAVRDEWERVRDVWVCDQHDPTLKAVNGSQKEYMEERYGK